MKSFCALLFLFLLAGGCAKKEEPPAAAAAPAEAAPTAAVPAVAAPDTLPAARATESSAPASRRRRAQTEPVPAPPAKNEAELLQGMVHPFMTSQLQIFIKEKGRLPQDFSEFAAARMDSPPRPPAGMEWMIDFQGQRVIVVKRKN